MKGIIGGKGPSGFRIDRPTEVINITVEGNAYIAVFIDTGFPVVIHHNRWLKVFYMEKYIGLLGSPVLLLLQECIIPLYKFSEFLQAQRHAVLGDKLFSSVFYFQADIIEFSIVITDSQLAPPVLPIQLFFQTNFIGAVKIETADSVFPFRTCMGIGLGQKGDSLFKQEIFLVIEKVFFFVPEFPDH